MGELLHEGRDCSFQERVEGSGGSTQRSVITLTSNCEKCSWFATTDDETTTLVRFSHRRTEFPLNCYFPFWNKGFKRLKIIRSLDTHPCTLREVYYIANVVPSKCDTVISLVERPKWHLKCKWAYCFSIPPWTRFWFWQNWRKCLLQLSLDVPRFRNIFPAVRPQQGKLLLVPTILSPLDGWDREDTFPSRA